MLTLQTDVDRLGAELVMCTDNCAGICCDQAAGVLPRGLHLERPNARGRGCLAVGLNPGRLDSRQQEFFRDAGATYDSVKAFYAKHDFPFSKKARDIIDQVGIAGPIIWSNVAKCENASERQGLPHLQTMSHCADRFLRRELEATLNDWPVFAFGCHAFLALAYLAPKRIIIGIPHPTGHGGQEFNKMLEKNGQLRKKVKDRAADALSATEQRAVWLGSRNQAL